MSLALHHAAICTSDLDSALRFWRDGLGLQQQFDAVFTGRWPELFKSRSGELRSVFLADPDQPTAGIVELVIFEGADPQAPSPPQPRHGFFLLSFQRDPDETLARLAELGLDRGVRQIRQPAGNDRHVPMAVVTAPDGVVVELIGALSEGAA